MEEGELKKETALISLQDGIDAIKKIKPEDRTPVHDRDLQIFIKELERQKASSNSDGRA